MTFLRKKSLIPILQIEVLRHGGGLAFRDLPVITQETHRRAGNRSSECLACGPVFTTLKSLASISRQHPEALGMGV